MIRSKLNLSLCLTAMFALPLVGCGGGETTSDGTDSQSTSETDPSGTSTTDGTTGETENPTGSETAGETDGTTTTEDPTDTTATTAGDPCEGVERQDAGQQCSQACDCKKIDSIDLVDGGLQYDDMGVVQGVNYTDPEEDGVCFLVPLLGGQCGQCVTSDDCGGGEGCTIPNPLASGPSFCNDGSAGAGCDAEGANTCQDGLSCGIILDAAGILTVATCGECVVNEDCGAETPYCAPTIDVANFTGVNQCVAEGSIPDNTACTIGDDAACEGGVCGKAVVMGVIEVGICGNCTGDADCAPGEVCSEPTVDIDTIPEDPNNPPPDYMPLQGPTCQTP